MSGHLRRSHAPISDAAWEAIDAEATRTLRHYLTFRKLIDFSGPHGWDHSAVTVGRTRPLATAPIEGTAARARCLLPLIEVRSPFELSIEALDIERGADDVDLEPVVEAATRAALAEDTTIFRGLEDADIVGIDTASVHEPLAISGDYMDYPGLVARAVAQLQRAGVGGPYAIALGPRCYTGVVESTPLGGYPVLDHIRTILGGPLVWAPAVDGAIVLSTRGGDFRLTVGQDFSVGYLGHDDASVRLHIEESFTFEVLEGRAAIRLQYPE